jgi:hypothetical protein
MKTRDESLAAKHLPAQHDGRRRDGVAGKQQRETVARRFAA